MRRAVRIAPFGALLFFVACLDGRGSIIVDGARAGAGDDDDTGPGLDIGGGDADADGDPDGFGDGDADTDADADSDGPGGDADADGDSDGQLQPDDGAGACVPPAGPFGSQRGDTLADFVRPLPECGTSADTTLQTFCEASAIVIHFNSPG